MNLTRLCQLVAAAALIGLPLHASVLVPGATNVAPDVFSNPSNPPLLGDITGTFNIGGGLLTGTWEEVVLVDPLGVTCTGCLDFGFQVSVDSTSNAPVFSTNFARFFSYTTDVGYVTGSGDVAPNSVSRGAGGGGIIFNFNTNATVLLPGESSDFLVVATNATTFDRNGVLTISGGANNQNVSGPVTSLFEPTFVAPEPASWVLILTGAAALAVIRRRR